MRVQLMTSCQQLLASTPANSKMRAYDRNTGHKDVSWSVAHVKEWLTLESRLCCKVLIWEASIGPAIVQQKYKKSERIRLRSPQAGGLEELSIVPREQYECMAIRESVEAMNTFHRSAVGALVYVRD